jgi:nucleoside-diphosphate-sugar epimerase
LRRGGVPAEKGAMAGTLLTLGHGYTADALARRLMAEGWRVVGTTRSAPKAEAMAAAGIEPVIWPGEDLAPALGAATHVLASAGPGPEGDPILPGIAPALGAAAPVWLGYLSTTGVYGDREGGWVDEDSPLAPGTERGRRRVLAERQWQVAAREHGLPLHIFRLAGIYGPGRGPFAKVRDGTARRIVKPGQVFSRIHVADIVAVLAASMARPDPGRVYNVCDDDPAPPQEVLAHAADLLGLPRPPEVAFEAAELSPMARSFYAESKRVRNDRIKRELGLRLRYPSYREGLAALLAEEEGGAGRAP